MPTYEYECSNCEHAFELFQQMSDSVKRKCPECGKLSLKRLIGTGAGVIFKGGGFYETDYRSDSYKKAADADKQAAKKPDSGSTGGGKESKKPETPSKGKSDSGKKPEGSKSKGDSKKKSD